MPEVIDAQHKLAENHLLFLSSMVKQTTEGIAITDLGGNLLFVNNAFAFMHGYKPDEVLGKHLSILHTQEQMSSVDAANKQLRETGEFSGEIWHVRRDGTTFPTLMQNSLLRDEQGVPIGMIKTVRDITKRRLAEDQLKEANRKLLELESLKEDLVNMVVHDMRNPVANTMLSLDMIEIDAGGHLTEQQREHLGIIKHNQFKLSEMIANLLEISKLESGEFPINKVSINTLALMNRIAERYRLMAEKEKKLIEVSVDPTAQEIVCDERLLERILSNMLSNAIKHSYPSGKIVLKTTRAAEQDCAVFSVKDSGEGIPKEYHQKIFEKFRQADVRELGYRSDTGLGLTFCKMAVEALGGKIWLESEKGKGSCFNFSLPGSLMA